MLYGQIKIANDVEALMRQLPDKERAGIGRGFKGAIKGGLRGTALGALGGSVLLPGLGTIAGAGLGGATGAGIGGLKGLLKDESKYEYLRRVARNEPRLLAAILNEAKK